MLLCTVTGIPVRDIFEILIQEATHLKVKPDIDVVVKKKLEISQITVAEVGTPKIDVVVAIAHKYHGKVPLAVASSGNRSNVLDALRSNGILDLFDAVVTAEDVVNHKPAPDIFLLAAHKLGCDPKKCRGYEDANAGLQALHAAGMEAVDVRLLSGYPHVEASSKSVLEMEYRGEAAQFVHRRRGTAKKDEQSNEISTFLVQLVVGGVLAYLVYLLLAHLVYEAVKEDAWSAD